MESGLCGPEGSRLLVAGTPKGPLCRGSPTGFGVPQPVPSPHSLVWKKAELRQSPSRCHSYPPLSGLSCGARVLDSLSLGNPTNIQVQLLHPAFKHPCTVLVCMAAGLYPWFITAPLLSKLYRKHLKPFLDEEIHALL